MLLIVLNLRSIKESVKVLLPVFIVFLITMLLLIFGSLGMHLSTGAAVVREVADEVNSNLEGGLGLMGMLALLMHAYTMGAGTYTGIEAVSNSMPVMREPRVATAKRTMTYMAFSLAITAGGLMIAYCCWACSTATNRTMNQVLSERFVADLGLGGGDSGSTSSGSRSWPKACCCSWPRRPALSTVRACWPTWPTIPGCRTGSPTSPNGWPRTTA